MTEKEIKKRIQRTENILIDLALFKGKKCKYIYIDDLQKALKKEGLIKEIPKLPSIHKTVYINPKKRKKKKKK